MIMVMYLCPNGCNRTLNRYNELNRVCINFDQIAPWPKHTLTVTTDILSVVTDDLEKIFIA
jgi:hypothetical protein